MTDTKSHKSARLLKDENAGQKNGVHKLIDCVLCDKKAIRSDNFSVHFASHLKKTKATDAADIIEALIPDEDIRMSIDNVDSVIFRSVTVNSKPVYLYGACCECLKGIINPTPSTNECFVEHICKEQKERMKQEKAKHDAKEPDDFKTLWNEMGKLKMSDKMKMAHEFLPSVICGDEDESKHNLMITSFVEKALKSEMTGTGSGTSNGSLLQSFKKHSVTLKHFESITEESDILKMYIRRLAEIKTQQDKIGSLESEIQEMEQNTIDLRIEAQRVKNLTQKLTDFDAEFETQRLQNEALCDRIKALENALVIASPPTIEIVQ